MSTLEHVLATYWWFFLGIFVATVIIQLLLNRMFRP